MLRRSPDATKALPGFEPVSSLSYGDPSSGNRLIEGDNATVLDELGRELTGRVRCVYLDPPYNTSERWVHYEDGLHHDVWLAGIERALRRIWPCVAEDGSLWMSINDAGVHHLRVLADQVLGARSFVTTVVWEHRTTRENRRSFSNNHEYLLVYAKEPKLFRESRNRLPATAGIRDRYQNRDGDPRGPWQSVSLNVQAGHGTPTQFYELIAPNGQSHRPPKGRCWVHTHQRMAQLMEDGRIWFGKDGNGVPRLKRFLAESDLTVAPETLWTAEVAGTTTSAKRHLLSMFKTQALFDTPKPEQLIQRVLAISSNEGDLVLDAYLGSGTTAAVAHKMNRRWVGIESGDHAATHCAERLRMVVEGEAGGVSNSVRWEGGGGFEFLRHFEEVAEAA